MGRSVTRRRNRHGGDESHDGPAEAGRDQREVSICRAKRRYDGDEFIRGDTSR